MGHYQQDARNRVVYFVINIIPDVSDPYTHNVGDENGCYGHKYDEIVLNNGIVEVSDLSNEYEIKESERNDHNPQI